MTLHAVYRFDDNSAIFISDFRLTEAGSIQSDNSFKFFSDDEKMGLFLSGDVELWKIILKDFNSDSFNINRENVLNSDGPFKEHLTNCALRFSNCSIAKAIGFVIDDEKRENILFQVEVKSGYGAIISIIESNDCNLIGAGPLVPDLKERIINRVQNDIKFFGMDLYRLADGMRKEALETIQSCGATAFSEFGISPIMFVSSLVDSCFIIRGEEITTGKFSDNVSPMLTKYSFTTNTNGQKVLLEYNDKFETREVVLHDIKQIIGSKNQIIFDPEQREQLYDPIEDFPNRSFIHLFHQWVIPNNPISNINTIYRSIKKIIITEVGSSQRKIKILSPLEAKLEIKEVSEEDLMLYPDTRDNYIVIDESLEEEFDAFLELNNLFDHESLTQYIVNYKEILYNGIP